MTVTLELDREDARFLYAQLARHAETMQDELAHTEQHELQHSLAQDLTRMQRVIAKLDDLLK